MPVAGSFQVREALGGRGAPYWMVGCVGRLGESELVELSQGWEQDWSDSKLEADCQDTAGEGLMGSVKTQQWDPRG